MIEFNLINFLIVLISLFVMLSFAYYKGEEKGSKRAANIITDYIGENLKKNTKDLPFKERMQLIEKVYKLIS